MWWLVRVSDSIRNREISRGEINQGKSTHKVRGKERGGGPLSPSRVPHARLRKKITKLVPATQAVVSSFTL